MGRFFESITDDLRSFIEGQHMFFVASAPLAAEGRVNVSPKGLDTLRVLGPHRVAYLDLTGSGNETAAHVLENGRVTLMFCAFEGVPKILRLYGTGRVVLPSHKEWRSFETLFPDLPGARQIVIVDVASAQTSCGFGVPLFTYEGERDTLIQWADRKGAEGIARYHEEKNAVSIDGLKAR